ncbi:MAG TPA: DUF1361 domain-containing protein [Candidatus Obscuribacterales bacterium]
MTAQVIATITSAWYLLQSNIHWMGWNLFLALVPLAMSFWLFGRPRSRFLRWGVYLLTGATFVYGVQRYDFVNLVNLIRSLPTTIPDLDTIYLVGAIAITLVLMVLDIWLLRGRGSRSFGWWVGFLVFISFLPNAPYVLTDIIHLIDDIRRYSSVWLITLAIVPLYLLFMVSGFEAYVLSVIYLGDYLRRHGWGKYILWVELTVHSLSAIGIYLGRFQRFNSWHIITQPDEVFTSLMNDLVGKFPALVMAITFVVITCLYWIAKQLTLGIMLRTQPRIALEETST